MKKNIFSVENLVVVITGSGRGIGLELAIAFIKNGANVIRIDKNLKKVKKYHFHDFQTDLSNFKITSEILSKIKKKFKQIDVLINNAGISIKSNRPYDKKILQKTLSANLFAAYNLSNLVCKIMSEITRKSFAK